MQEPVFTVLGVNPTTLMRAVDVGLALCQHDFMFVRTIGTFTAHGQLEACWHPTCRAHNPIPAIAFVELRSFAGAVFITITVEHDNGIADGTCAVCRQFTNRQYRSELSTRVGPAIHQITASVVIPERGGVNHSLTCYDTYRFLPSADRVLRLHHEYTVVGVAPIDVILTIVVADAGSPDSLAVGRLVEYLFGFQLLEGIADDFPVHQVARMENGQSRDAVER